MTRLRLVLLTVAAFGAVCAPAAVRSDGTVQGLDSRWRVDRRYGVRGRAVAGLPTTFADPLGSGILLEGSGPGVPLAALDVAGRATPLGAQASQALRDASRPQDPHDITAVGRRIADLIVHYGSTVPPTFHLAVVGPDGALRSDAHVVWPDDGPAPTAYAYGLVPVGGSRVFVVVEQRWGSAVRGSRTGIVRLRLDGTVDTTWAGGVAWVGDGTLSLVPWHGGVVAVSETGLTWVDAPDQGGRPVRQGRRGSVVQDLQRHGARVGLRVRRGAHGRPGRLDDAQRRQRAHVR
jgi:hypothetical protein